jgi:hypothetical protein
MSEPTVKALAAGLPAALPGDSVAYLIGVLTGTEKLDRAKGVKAGYELVGYLLGRFFSETTAAALPAAKPKAATKKQIAEALQGLSGEVGTKAVPAWLIPVVLGLVQKWIENRR